LNNEREYHLVGHKQIENGGNKVHNATPFASSENSSRQEAVPAIGTLQTETLARRRLGSATTF
jgi:hypothetical protein